jgi:glutamine---fructose-6-phosphate transaminase (isomerizing)
MCGIIGYIGENANAFDSVLTGLKNLEHRGYDSAGALFCFAEGEAELYKVSNKEKPDFTIRDLTVKIKDVARPCHLGIGHTRWASCGTVSEKNAHPHCDSKKRIWVVHNGNVVNFERLKKFFVQDHLYSETDTEIIANLIARQMSSGLDLCRAVEEAMLMIEGPNAILVVDSYDQDVLVAANRGGTLLYGRNDKGEFLIASDPAPLEILGLAKLKSLGDGEIILSLKKEDRLFYFSADDDQFFPPEQTYKEFSCLMEKEIFEQPTAFTCAIGGRLILEDGLTRFGGLQNHIRDLRSAQRFHFLGCGTAYHACQYAVLLLNRFGIEAEAHVSSEFCYGHKVFDHSDVFFIVSQSGETADSIKALKEIKIKGNPVFGIVNREGSRIWRETGAGIHIAAGAERSVASTKAFTCQLLSIAMLAVFLARQRKMTADTAQRIIKQFKRLPSIALQALDSLAEIKKLAKKYSNAKNFYFLGRYFNSIVASEGALKLKEVSYVHAEAYPLGEMKHGPLALIDENFVSLVIAPNDSTYQESLGNIREIKARHGKVIVVSDSDDFDTSLCDDLIHIPSTLDYLSPIISIIPLQLFAYCFAVALGLNPDKPRNLAKTVTVN